jgi:hypothetical protein
MAKKRKKEKDIYLVWRIRICLVLRMKLGILIFQLGLFTDGIIDE